MVPASLGSISFLYQFAFIGFKDISLFHSVIQMPTFYPITKNIKIFEVNKYAQTQNQ
jgi:hypothetical protein